MNIRMLGPAVAATTTVNGRSYVGVVGYAYDVPDFDADVLGTCGWAKVCPSGPTSARPTPNGQLTSQYWAHLGFRFFDTSLGKIIVYDGATWRDPSTGTSV